MKKVLLGYFLFVILSSFSFAQVNITPVRTDVSGFSDWTDNNVGGTTYLQLLKAGASTISPALNFNSYTSEKLDFKARTFGGVNATENEITVSISTDNGSNWTVLGTRTPTSTTLTAVTQFDLSSYGGIQVKIKFSVAGTNDGIGAGIDDITIIGTVTEPTTQATSISFSTVTTNSFTINWTIGNGSRRALFMKEGSGAITNPADGSSYTASANWSSKGTQLGSSGYYCIYDGTSNTVDISNLAAGTTYYVQAFEYNGSGTSADYLTSTATGNPNSQATEASLTPTLTISHDGLTELNLNGAVINLTLTNETFADGGLSSGNFTLNNAPAGTTVNSVSYLTNTTATLTLDYDGTDFDANVTTFNVTIAGAELTLGSPLTSNNLTITATVEVAPTVTTNDAITSKTSTTATWEGNVSADGGEAVTQKGVVWNTSANPTTDNSKTTEGGGTGSITGSMTGLSPNTLYYVRAYATNSVGTNYGTEKSFTTDGLSAPTSGPATNVSSTGFTANWSTVEGAASYRLDISTYQTFNSASNATDLFISEYIEGSSYNKAIEIYNGTGSSVDLSVYTLKKQTNGAGVFGNDLTLSGSLSHGSAYLIVYSSADATLLGKANLSTSSSCVNFNGNDAVALYKSGGQIDVVGIVDQVANWGADVTLIRKSSITGPTTTYSISDWNSEASDYFDNAGIHTYGTPSYVSGFENKTVNGTSDEVSGLTPGTTYYYRVRGYSSRSTSSNSSTVTVTTANNSQTASVSGNGAVPIGGTTGIGSLTFSGVTNPGDILVSRFNNTPQNVSGVVGNVSGYRWVIENSGVVFASCDFRLNLGDIPDHGILEGADDIILYKRGTPGTGAFSVVGTMTYNDNGTPGNQSDDYLTLSGITSFSEFIIGSENSPLPVELTSFTAKVIGGKVNLNWSTSTEVNNYGFEIERSLSSHSSSLNGHLLPAEWEKIGFVAGSGNSNSLKEYSFADDFSNSAIQPFNHSIRYRLKQIDNDGTFVYSKEVEVLNSKPSTYQLSQNFPNPFNPSTVISYQLPVSAQVTLKVFDVLGNEVASLVNQQQDAGSYNVTLDASSLASGTYIYRLIAGDFVSTKKLVVLK